MKTPDCNPDGSPVRSSIGSSDLLGLVLDLVRFPNPRVCRHYVALNILSMMEKKGISLPPELVESISQSSEGDEQAEKILLRLLKTG